jgi:hypothetical protein
MVPPFTVSSLIPIGGTPSLSERVPGNERKRRL